MQGASAENQCRHKGKSRLQDQLFRCETKGFQNPVFLFLIADYGPHKQVQHEGNHHYAQRKNGKMLHVGGDVLMVTITDDFSKVNNQEVIVEVNAPISVPSVRLR